MSKPVIHFRGPYNSKTACGRTERQTKARHATQRPDEVTCVSCRAVMIQRAEDAARGYPGAAIDDDMVGTARRRPIRVGENITTTVSTIRRIVKEELEQLTLPGVSMGPTGLKAWDAAWERLQQAQRRMNTVKFGDTGEWSKAKKELVSAKSAFDAINDATEEDTAGTERVYGRGGLGT